MLVSRLPTSEGMPACCTSVYVVYITLTALLLFLWLLWCMWASLPAPRLVPVDCPFGFGCQALLRLVLFGRVCFNVRIFYDQWMLNGWV